MLNTPAIEQYTFTGYYPSRNPFLWYYDEHKKVIFLTSLETEEWDIKPKEGDKIELMKKYIPNKQHPSHVQIMKAYLNGKLVWEYSE